MKKLFVLAAFLLLSGCGDDSLHVDMEDELRNRPTVTLTTQEGVEIPGYSASFCTDTVCFEAEVPNYAALTYTPIMSGADLTLNVEWAKDSEISTLSVKTIDKNGEVTHRELPYTQVDANTFVFDEAFPTDANEFTLFIKIDFVTEGSSQHFYPLQLQ